MTTPLIESLAELDGKLTLNAAAERLNISLASLWRYTLRGCRGVKLSTLNIGGRRYTTEAALLDFVRATTAAANGEQSPPTPATAARQRKTRRQEIRREFGIDAS
jgi:hypothetical protein